MQIKPLPCYNNLMLGDTNLNTWIMVLLMGANDLRLLVIFFFNTHRPYQKKCLKTFIIQVFKLVSPLV